MKVLFALTEADPFIKTGGLGEVGGSLPLALREQGVEIRVILPKYSSIASSYRQAMNPLGSFTVPLAWRNQYCGLEELEYQGIHYYFLDNEYYFRRSKCYGDEDEGEQYAFFSRAVLESIRYLSGFKPDIIHCHDWHTALIPLFLKVFYAQDTLYYKIRTLFTIHNLKYQGSFSKETLADVLGLSWDYFTPDGLEFNGGINFMKAGIRYSDRVTTVSPTYAEEIQHPHWGEGLHEVIRTRQDSLKGILNGVPEAKGAQDLAAKRANRKKLQTQLGLLESEDMPILCMVSRLVEQKGVDLLLHVMEEILALDIQFIILGSGDPHYEERIKEFGHRFPDKFRPLLCYQDDLAQCIYAGADIFLMPSRYEPCGIAQMIAMSYGNIPVVRETGGLKDTVIPYSITTGEGNGFTFTHYNAHEFLYAIQGAVKMFRENKEAWLRLWENALNSEFSWSRSAAKYYEVYEDLYYLK
ncbi:glycogen/starch synthase, ADP-glucose type [Desulfitobacterium dichloroeliminans LMG P-21439]|uniref:Glycogen synthase n=1 Tax=Desulfitobacterium dichloroeliminans (strain LMG P-21439 / DCA1) TaxID=871963 RepID=L0F9M5_DESDL|nr:glycogen synthase GlgA [Desulfitobacterium dichloroeliminans]AGA69643.1 glycogen/starch synthase, ADP-glucose type [Desulfitobacterium dichloroeliminans LMG P-21439]